MFSVRDLPTPNGIPTISVSPMAGDEREMIETNWHVITGAPCSGKTTVIRELERRGFKVVHEVARAYIDGELAKGKTMEMIKADEMAFERHILLEKLAIESALDQSETVFLDRAIPDSIAYYRLHNLNPDEPIEYAQKFRYKTIFQFERFEFDKDRVRDENDVEAGMLDRLLHESYKQSGYDILRVPVAPVSERVRFTLAHLSTAL